jgi:hypothetical protein
VDFDFDPEEVYAAGVHRPPVPGEPVVREDAPRERCPPSSPLGSRGSGIKPRKRVIMIARSRTMVRRFFRPRVLADRSRTRRPATANPLRAIRSLARRQGADREALLRHRFDVARVEDLARAGLHADRPAPGATGVVSEPTQPRGRGGQDLAAAFRVVRSEPHRSSHILPRGVAPSITRRISCS